MQVKFCISETPILFQYTPSYLKVIARIEAKNGIEAKLDSTTSVANTGKSWKHIRAVEFKVGPHTASLMSSSSLSYSVSKSL